MELFTGCQLEGKKFMNCIEKERIWDMALDKAEEMGLDRKLILEWDFSDVSYFVATGELP